MSASYQVQVGLFGIKPRADGGYVFFCRIPAYLHVMSELHFAMSSLLMQVIFMQITVMNSYSV